MQVKKKNLDVFLKKCPFLATKILGGNFFVGKNVQVRVRAQKLGCGCVRCTLVCVVRVGADENLIQAGGTPVLALVQIKSIFLH